MKDYEIHCSCDSVVELDRLIPNPQNPHTHPEKQIAKLAKLIRFFGIRHPITVSRRSGFIVSGHCRLLAAQALGLKTFPVDYQDFEDEATEWAVLTSDNNVAEFAEIDGQLMADGLVMLDSINFDLELTALDPDQVQQFILGPTAMPDDLPDVNIQGVGEISDYLIVQFDNATIGQKARKSLDMQKVDRIVPFSTVRKKWNIKL